jgi:hypothetical protein
MAWNASCFSLVHFFFRLKGEPMSHIVQIQTQVRDPVAVACQRLNLASPQIETVKLFTTTETGLVVRLNGWRYPVVCDLASGSVKYNNDAFARPTK